MIRLPFLVGGDTIKNYDKEIAQAQLNNEKEVLRRLAENYEDALEEINSKIAQLMGRADADLQHVVYQVEYQKALKAQVQSILLQLQSNEFETVSEYLAKCYDEGFLGTMYSLQSQGVPLAFPIDQEDVVAAIQHETNLSTTLYKSFDMARLQKTIASEISRGFSVGSTYSEIARNIAASANVEKNKATRIARTEGHRIVEKGAYNAQVKAADRGADVVKIWDAALDAKTRESHVKVDGEIREVKKRFSNGLLYPGDPAGSAAEVVNCRCRSRTEARWALDEEQTKILGDTSEMSQQQRETIAKKLGIHPDDLDLYSGEIVPINAKNYEDFKWQYNKYWHYKGSEVQQRAEARIASYGKTATNSKKTLEKQDESAKIVPDKVVTGHSGTPKKAAPRSVIDHQSDEGVVDARAFYGADGMKEKDLHTTDHGNPKWHNYGQHGEHAHDYEWNEDGSLKNKTTREWNNEEKERNGDIL